MAAIGMVVEVSVEVGMRGREVAGAGGSMGLGLTSFKGVLCTNGCNNNTVLCGVPVGMIGCDLLVEERRDRLENLVGGGWE